MSNPALKMLWFMVSLVFCIGIGTLSYAQAIQPVPPTPIDIKKVELGGTPWNPEWDQIIEQALPPKCFLRTSPGACVDSAHDFTRWRKPTNAHFACTSSRHLQALKPD